MGGMGASRVITGVVDNTTLEIDRPFDDHLRPDSFMVVVSTYGQKVVAGDTFVWAEVVQYCGVTLEGVFAENEFHNENENHTQREGGANNHPALGALEGSMRAIGECYHGAAPVFFTE